MGRKKLSGVNGDIKAFFQGPDYDARHRLTELIGKIVDGKETLRGRVSRLPEKDELESKIKDLELILSTMGSEQVIDWTLKLIVSKGINFNPKQYLAHMLTEPTIPGLEGYIIGMCFSGNRVADEVSPVEACIEELVGNMIKDLIGYSKNGNEFSPYDKAFSLMTTGGTEANLIAMILARDESVKLTENHNLKNYGAETFIENPAVNGYINQQLLDNRIPVVILPESYHYSFERIMNVIGIGSSNIRTVAVNSDLRMDIDNLREVLSSCRERGEKVVSVVGVYGTTECGAADDLEGILRTVRDYENKIRSEGFGDKVWLHADAAWGLPYILLDETQRKAIQEFDSVTFDPHKMLATPYGAGSLTVKDKNTIKYMRADAPYLDFEKQDDGNGIMHRGLHRMAGSIGTGPVLGTFFAMNALSNEGLKELSRYTNQRVRNLAEMMMGSGVGSCGRIEVLNKDPDMNLLLFRFVPYGFEGITREAVKTSLNNDGIICDETLRSMNERLYDLQDKITRRINYSDLPFLISKEDKVSRVPLYAHRICVLNPYVDDELLKNFMRTYLAVADSVAGENDFPKIESY